MRYLKSLSKYVEQSSDLALGALFGASFTLAIVMLVGREQWDQNAATLIGATLGASIAVIGAYLVSRQAEKLRQKELAMLMIPMLLELQDFCGGVLNTLKRNIDTQIFNDCSSNADAVFKAEYQRLRELREIIGLGDPTSFRQLIELINILEESALPEEAWDLDDWQQTYIQKAQKISNTSHQYLGYLWSKVA